METKVIRVSHPIVLSDFDAPGRAIREGRVVAFPTETVYGLGASAFLPDAVRMIFTLKGRPSDNPLIVHLGSRDELDKVALDIPEIFHTLYEVFSPGPVTYVMPRNTVTIPDEVCRLSTVAVRFPSKPSARALIVAAGVPIVAPSANLSGRPSPTLARHVLHDFDGKLPYIIDDGPCEVGVESAVLDLTSDPVRILRPGIVTAEMIYEKTGIRVVRWRPETDGGDAGRPPSPGMKYRHYAPRARVVIVMPREGKTLDGVFAEALSEAAAMPYQGGFSGASEKADVSGSAVSEDIGAEVTAIPCKTPDAGASAGKFGVFLGNRTWETLSGRLEKTFAERVLSYTYPGEHDVYRATHGLFDALRTLDDRGVSKVFAEGFREATAAAYMDRLVRAAGGSGGEKPLVRQILFLCTANTCRSPMAEALFNDRKIDGWHALSAGLLASPGDAVSPLSEDVLQEIGIDASGHRSRSVFEDGLMAASAIVVTMTDEHRRELIRFFPEAAPRIFSFSSFSQDGRDIDDPYGLSKVSYRKTRDRLIDGMDSLIAFLRDLPPRER